MTDLTPIVQAIISLAVALVTAFIIPWIKTKLNQSQLDSIQAWAAIAVQAAEQIYSSTQGAEKKQYVLDYLTNKGFKIDANSINVLIESTVLELHSELYGSDKETQ